MSLLPRARTGLLCPVSADHGPLIPWHSETWGWHCSHREHDGVKGEPATRSFFTTAEAERGSLPAEPLRGADTPARSLNPAAVPLYPETDPQPTPSRGAAMPGTP